MIATLSFIFLFGIGYGGNNDDFRLGIQLCDKKAGKNTGDIRYTPYVSENGGWSVWAGDSNYYDPDGMRIGIFGPPPPPPPKYPPKYPGLPPPPPPFKIVNKDIRLCIQLTDHATNSKGNPTKEGKKRCTPWASSGGGWSKFAGDSNFYDYDAVRVKLQTRKKPGLVISNIRVGVRLTDDGTNKNKRGSPEYTKWFAQSKDTWSEWAGDSNFYDADSIQIYLEADCPKGADTNIFDWDGDYDGYGGYYLYITLIGIIAVLITINIICCYINYINNKNNIKQYKAVSYDTDTDP